MIRSYTWLIAATVLLPTALAFQTTASADLIAHEDFESYSAGALNGNGAAGDGWTGGWTTTFGANNYQVISGGLNYSNGDIQVDGGDRAVQVANNAASNRPFEATSADSIYFSMLFSYPQDNDAVPGSNDLVGLHLTDDADPQDNYATMGKMPNTDNFAIRLDDGGFDTQASDTTVTRGETYFLIGRLSFDGTSTSDKYDLLEMWVNPTSTTLGTADAVLDNNMGIDGGIDSLILRAANGPAGDYVMDELRVGTDVGSVIPEPASMTLLGIGGLLAIWSRRRR